LISPHTQYGGVPFHPMSSWSNPYTIPPKIKGIAAVRAMVPQ
jgi:hypothetical protein